MPPGDQSPDHKGRIFVEPYGWVLPVRNQAGEILYYTDESGQRVGNPLAGPGSGGIGQYVTRTVDTTFGKRTQRDYQDNSADAARRRAKARAERQDPETGVEAKARDKAAINKYNKGYAWLDGKRLKITGQAENGDLTYALDGKEQENPYKPPTAYGALEGGELPDGGTQFLMSVGPRTNGSDPTRWDAANGNLASMLMPEKLGASNYMTIANGLQWLVALSAKDPELYQLTVDKLHNAGYLSDANYASAGGGWSQDVGMAFALAARDVAVVNNQGGANGAATTLDTLLADKAGASEKAKQAARAAAYQPTDRKYTDPEDIKAAARSEAEQTLGRRLTDAEEAQLVGHFRSLEDAKYDAMDSAGKSGKSARYTDPGQGQIASFVEDGAHEQEAANFRAAGYGQMIMNLFGVTS